MAGRDAAIAAALDELVAAASAVSEEPSRVARRHAGGRCRREGGLDAMFAASQELDS